MYLKIKTYGHQDYSEFCGLFNAWTTGVEKFDGVFMQVPAVILMGGDGNVCIMNLQEQFYRFAVEAISDEEYRIWYNASERT